MPRSAEAVERGLGIIQKNYSNTLKKGRLTEAAMAKRLGKISTATSLTDAKVAEADVVVEAMRPGSLAKLGLGFDELVQITRRSSSAPSPATAPPVPTATCPATASPTTPGPA